MKRKKLAYSFIRFSSKKQEIGKSLKRQTKRTEQYAAKKGLILDENTTLKALGVSGYSGAHIKPGSALGGFLAAVKEGKIPRGTVLIVEALDRLSRLEPLEAFEIFTAILRAGVEIHTLQDQQVYTEASVNANIGQLYVSIGTLFGAHDESKRKGDRIRFTWKEKKENASREKPITKRIPLWLRIVDGRIEEEPERAAVVRRIFELKASGRGKRVIANILNEEGVETFGKSREWLPSYIYKILTNRAVLGEYHPQTKKNGKTVADGKIVENYFPRIIEWWLWNAADIKLQGGRIAGATGKPTGANDGAGNLVSGLVYSKDGHKMCFENKNSQRDWQYLTDRKGTSVNYWKFLERFTAALDEKLDWKNIEQEARRRNTKANKAAEGLEKELARNREKVKATTLLIGSSKLKELRDLLGALEKDRARIDKQLAAKRTEGKDRVVTEEEFVKAIDEGNMLFKLAVRNVIRKIVVYKADKFDLVLKTGKVVKVGK